MADQNQELHKVIKQGGRRYVFQKTNRLRDQSYTVSFDLENNSWVSFHDYIPDLYFSTRRQLFTLKNNSLWYHNRGPFGTFYNKDVKNSFYVDIVFSFDQEVFLNSVQFVTKILHNVDSVTDWKSITHITIWNDNQCSDRVAIDSLKEFVRGSSKSQSEYSFNEFRDMVRFGVVEFIDTIFKDYKPIEVSIDKNKAWYDQAYLQDRFFIVRLEYDNNASQQISIHQVNAEVEPTI